MSLEKAGWYLEPLLHEASPSVDGNINISQENKLWTSAHAFASPSLSSFPEIEPSYGNRSLASRYILLKLNVQFCIFAKLCNLQFVVNGCFEEMTK